MKWVRNYKLFKESKNSSKMPTSKNLVRDICVSMILINNEFLDPILDKGLKSRYQENSHVFLNDLKNLIIAKNRLNIGKFSDGQFVINSDFSKLSELFNRLEFNIEEDWKTLVDSRTIARAIIDKIEPDKKLSSDDIKSVYLNIEKENNHKEDIILELNDGRQFSFYLNKNLASQKTSSFSLFADDLIGSDIDGLYKNENSIKWDKLVQQWITIIYLNANKNIQNHIEKFIDVNKIDSINYFEYFDIRHRDPKFKYLGEFIKEFDKNILKFSDLLDEIWKNRDRCFMDPERVFKEWVEIKIVILNSKILEHILTKSLKSNHSEDIKVVEDGYKLASGRVKMRLIKTIVEKMGCVESPVYFLSKNGEIFNVIPSREFFRNNYDDINIKFDYHVNFNVSDNEEENDFKIKIKLELDDKNLIFMEIIVKFSGGEMSGKLNAKYKFDIAYNFNYLISRKM